MLTVLLLPTAAIAGDADRAFKRWFDRYRTGRVDLREEVRVGIRDESGVTRYHKCDAAEELENLLADLVEQGDVKAARTLLDAAVYEIGLDRHDELRRHADSQPWLVRRLAGEALARIRSAKVTDWLLDTVLGSTVREDKLQRHVVAARAVATIADPRAIDPLRRLAASTDPRLRSEAARAMGKLRHRAGADTLITLLADRNPDVRLEALSSIACWESALAAGGSDPAESSDADSAFRQFMHTQVITAARSALGDPDWASRLLAAEILRKRPDPESVPILLEALIAEGPDQPSSRRRVRSAIRSALVSLTGRDIPSTRTEDWITWWEKSRDTFEIDAVLQEVLPEQGPRFFGLPIEADVVCFLLDASGSMARPAFGEGEPSRFFLASRELSRCLKDLQPGTRANLIVFSDDVTAFRSEPVTLDDESISAMIDFLDEISPDGGTDLFGALDQAVGLVDERDRSEGAGDLDLDTLVLLTDGIPSRGAVLQAEELLSQIEEANRRRRIAIHTVAVTKGGQSFLTALADQNHGASTVSGR